MALTSDVIGIDLGTSKTCIYVRGKGVVVDEPTLVAVERSEKMIVRGVGDEANHLYGRNPDRYTVANPLKNGVITDYTLAEMMLKYFIRKAIGASHFTGPTVLLTIPCSISDVNRQALTSAAQRASARHVSLVPKPFAAALGSGLPVYEPEGSLVVDIGAGTTDVAVISIGSTVVEQSVPVGGNRLDEALADYLKKEHGLLIGNHTAENLKKDLASALPLEEERTVLIRGINQLSAGAATLTFSTKDAYQAVREPCQAILKAIRWVLERTPPELCGDIMRNGIHLTGGGSRLFAIDRFISDSLGVPVNTARNPEDCTIMGVGYLTENTRLVGTQVVGLYSVDKKTSLPFRR